jgi:hypothetical protein
MARSLTVAARTELAALLLFRQVFLDVGQHFIGVLFHVDFGVLPSVNLADDARLVDDKCVPICEAAPFIQHAERRRSLLVWVGQDREGELLFLREFLLVFELIDTDADQYRIELSKLLSAVAKTAVLDRSAPGHGFGEKEKHDVFPFGVLGQLDLLGIFQGREALVDVDGGELD